MNIETGPYISLQRRVLSWLLIATGSVIILLALGHTFAQPQVPLSNSYVYEVHSSGSTDFSGSTSGFGGSDPFALSISFIVGIGVLMAGYVAMFNRFSLRMLMAAALLAGALGSLPIRFAPPKSGQADFKIVFEKPLTAAQIDAIREALEPSRALATLPPELLAELNLQGRRGIERVEVTPDAQGRLQGAKMKLFTGPQLTSEQRRMLIEFYLFYFEVLATEYAAENGAIKPRIVTTHFSAAFTPWKVEWVKMREEGKATGK